MNNLELIRAGNALDTAEKHGHEIVGDKDGEVIKKIPALIMNNGLLAVIAFAMDKGGGYQTTMNAVACHLSDSRIALVPKEVGTARELMKHLSEKTKADELALITAEAMAWLNYARRFIKKPDKKEA